jgi:hypothetical protein
VGFISGVANLRPKKKFLRLIADCIVAQKVNIFGKFSKLLFKDQFGLALLYIIWYTLKAHNNSKDLR